MALPGPLACRLLYLAGVMSRLYPFLTSTAVHGGAALLLGLGGVGLAWQPARMSVTAPKAVPLMMDLHRELREDVDFHRAEPTPIPLAVDDVELELEPREEEVDVLPAFAARPSPRPERPLRTSARVAAPAPVPEVESEIAPVDLHNPPPAYPAAARRRGQEGLVLADLSVGKDGAVEAVSIVACDGSPLFEAAVRKAAADWRYRPATLGGLPVASVRRVRFSFRLKD